MRRNALGLLALSLTGLAVAGCSSVRPFATTSLSDASSSDYAYLAGRATRTFAFPPVTVQTAVAAAMDDLRISAARQTRESGILILEGTTADNRKALLSLKPHPGNATHLGVRIGLFGDEPLSRALMDRVAIRLGTLPPSAIPVDPPSSPGSNPYVSRGAVPDSVMFKDVSEAPYKASPSP
jgi:hypothetical protein